jgi:hypothetical protein
MAHRCKLMRAAKIGIPNNDDLTKAHTSVQLSLQAQQNVNAQIEEILMQSREFKKLCGHPIIHHFQNIPKSN